MLSLPLPLLTPTYHSNLKDEQLHCRVVRVLLAPPFIWSGLGLLCVTDHGRIFETNRLPRGKDLLDVTDHGRIFGTNWLPRGKSTIGRPGI
jgi:hypothetical protein